MPSSVHKTQNAMFTKAKKLMKKGKNVRFDKVISQDMKKGKRIGKRKTEYILHWR